MSALLGREGMDAGPPLEPQQARWLEERLQDAEQLAARVDALGAQSEALIAEVDRVRAALRPEDIP